MNSNFSDLSFRWAWAWTVAVLTIFVTTPLLTPFVSPEYRGAIEFAFRPLCHQVPDRCFQVAGVPFAICHRCFGIYGGIWFAALVYPLLVKNDATWWSFSKLIVIGGAIPILVDVGLDIMELRKNTVPSRVFTGLVFGVTGGYFVVRGFIDLASSMLTQFRKTKNREVSE